MLAMVQRVNAVALNTPIFLRKKPDTTTMESLAERASALIAFGKEVQQQVPLPDALLEEAWLRPWQRGDDHVDTELQAVMHEKNEQFNPSQHVPTLRKLVDSHLFSAPVVAPVAMQQGLDIDTYQLLIKQMEYDMSVFNIWKKKCDNAFAARYHAQQDFKLAQHNKCLEAAQVFVSGCVRLRVWEPKMEDNVAEVMTFKKELACKVGQPQVSLPCLVYLNWTAPCSLTTKTQDNQIAILTYALGDNIAQSCALVLAPVFSYTRGKLFLEEKKMMDSLSKGNHNLDWGFSVLFKEQVDSRDLRPLTYPGRFVFPSPVGDLKKHAFFGCDLRKDGRTIEVKQLALKDLREVEDLAADALPPTSDPNLHIKASAKYCQIGSSAAEALLQKTLEGSSLQGTGALLLLDLNVGVGDMLSAFCSLRSAHASTTSLVYFGFSESQVELDWVLQHISSVLLDKFKDGSMKLPNGEQLQTTVPQDLLEPLPTLPRLNVLVATGSDENRKLQMPLPVFKQWKDHAVLGSEFVQWVEAFVQQGFTVASETAAPAGALLA